MKSCEDCVAKISNYFVINVYCNVLVVQRNSQEVISYCHQHWAWIMSYKLLTLSDHNITNILSCGEGVFTVAVVSFGVTWTLTAVGIDPVTLYLIHREQISLQCRYSIINTVVEFLA